jgi:hypothetical protein
MCYGFCTVKQASLVSLQFQYYFVSNHENQFEERKGDFYL